MGFFACADLLSDRFAAQSATCAYRNFATISSALRLFLGIRNPRRGSKPYFRATTFKRADQAHPQSHITGLRAYRTILAKARDILCRLCTPWKSHPSPSLNIDLKIEWHSERAKSSCDIYTIELDLFTGVSSACVSVCPRGIDSTQNGKIRIFIENDGVSRCNCAFNDLQTSKRNGLLKSCFAFGNQLRICFNCDNLESLLKIIFCVLAFMQANVVYYFFP